MKTKFGRRAMSGEDNPHLRRWRLELCGHRDDILISARLACGCASPCRGTCPRPRAMASSAAMKIARVEALHCDGGWRPWTFVRIETDDGLVGWGECSDNRSPLRHRGCGATTSTPLLIGQDPRPVERLYWDMLRATRQNLGGVTPQGDGRHRAGALGHQGQGARRAGLRAVRRPDARPHAAVLVALRDDARAATATCWARRRCAPTTTSPRSARKSWRAASPRSRPTS